MTRFHLTRFDNLGGKTKTEETYDFAGLLAMLKSVPEYPSKHTQPLLSLTAFGDFRSDDGSLRHTDNALGCWGAEMDYDTDGEVMQAEEAWRRLEAEDIEAIVYTSASNTPEKPRWRVLVRFDRLLGFDARREACERVNGVLGGVLTPETFYKTQSFYFGRVAGKPYFCEASKGRGVLGREDLPRVPSMTFRESTGGDGASNATIEETLLDGFFLHDCLVSLAFRGYTRGQLEDLMLRSAARTARPETWQQRWDEDMPRALKSAERKKAKEREKMLAAFAPPPMYEIEPIYTVAPAYPKPQGLVTINAASLAGKPIPPMKWLVEGLIPAEEVTMLSGDGGLGKSLLCLQLAAAVAGGDIWLGQRVDGHGPALYLSCEDDERELHRRLVRVAGDKLGQLTDLHLVDLTSSDAMLVEPVDRKLAVTDLYKHLAAKVDRLKPALVVLDSAADVFGGNEIVRAEVRWFIAQLRALCHTAGCTVVFLAHPSATGKTNRSGMSGSTAWNNSVRARLYFSEPDPAMSDEKPFSESDDYRVLKLMKSNRSARGSKVILEMRAGRFVNVDGIGGGRAGAEPPRIDGNGKTLKDYQDQADELFVMLLARWYGQRRYVSHKPKGTYAPEEFANTADAQAAGISRDQLVDAMNRLLDSGRIVIGKIGSGAKAIYQLEPAETASIAP